MLKNALILAVLAAALSVLFLKKIRQSRGWRATVTPLASIIGSGFLVVAPLLAHITGRYALLAMLVLVLLGYAAGYTLRFNILHLEALSPLPAELRILEKLSSLCLGIAYVISVTFYIQLLAAFVLKGLHMQSERVANLFATGILLFIAFVGKLRGLETLENLEEYSVSIKLAIIAAMLAGLAYFNGDLFHRGLWHWRLADRPLDTEAWRALFGSLIVVQGFETSRYLGNKYRAAERVRSMRFAQIFSGLIYLIFIALIGVAFSRDPQISDTAIIDLSGRVASLLPALLIIAATMSQFSAAVADTVGAGGLLTESLGKKISLHSSYLLIGLLTVGLTWVTDVFQVITLASRAFALYYALQAGAAARLAYRKRFFLRGSFFTALSFFLLLITFLGAPASA